MKMAFAITVMWIIALTSPLAGQDAKEIIKKADEKMQGELSSQSTMTMTIVTANWERSLSFPK